MANSDNIKNDAAAVDVSQIKAINKVSVSYTHLGYLHCTCQYCRSAGCFGSVRIQRKGYADWLSLIHILPFVIYDAYKIMYYIGDITLIPDYTSIIFGIVAAVVCTAVSYTHLDVYKRQERLRQAYLY